MTEAQIEAAVHAAWVKSREFRGVGGQSEFAPPWEFQQIIRAALAAAGAERDDAVAAIERVAVEIEAVAGDITSSSEAAGYRNGLLRAAQIVRGGRIK